MANFNLEDYETVADRIRKFYADHAEGRITTEVIKDDGKTIMIRASVYKGAEEVIWATGLAEEVRGEGFVNKTSAPENCETSAIGRALANANYAGDKRASREEMEKVNRYEEQSIQDRMQTNPAALVEMGKMLEDKGITDKADKALLFEILTPGKDWKKLNSSGITGLKKSIMTAAPDTLQTILEENR